MLAAPWLLGLWQSGVALAIHGVCAAGMLAVLAPHLVRERVGIARRA